MSIKKNEEPSDSGAADEIEAAVDYRRQQQCSSALFAIDPQQLANSAQYAIERIDDFAGKFPQVVIERVRSNLQADVEGLSHAEDKLTHLVVSSLAREVEAACERLGLDLRSGVAAGAYHGDGVGAMRQSVPGTRAGIVLISANLLLLCNEVSKLVIRSGESLGDFEPLKIAISASASEVAQVRDKELLDDWIDFFARRAVDPLLSPPGREYVLAPELHALQSDLLQAMELFVVAHEYAHHIEDHGRLNELGANGPNMDVMRNDELHADAIAIMICQELSRSAERSNLFLGSSAGALAIILVLELLRWATNIVDTGSAIGSARDTHPELDVRIQNIVESTKRIQGDVEESKFLRLGALQTIQHFWRAARSSLDDMHDDGVRSVRKTEQWLP